MANKSIMEEIQKRIELNNTKYYKRIDPGQPSHYEFHNDKSSYLGFSGLIRKRFERYCKFWEQEGLHRT